MKPEGVWIPIITPFYHGELDIQSYQHLIQHYLEQGVSGLIPLGTTGESPCVAEREFERLIESTMETVNHQIPIYIGCGGNDTAEVLRRVKILERYRVDGILSVCPYYNRPSQEGLYNHFLQISETTALNIMIYNIPYRTGINLENRTLFKLAAKKNIVAVKDSCGDIKQTLDLLQNKPEDFSVLTGEDCMFFTTLANGGDGGVLASAHLNTQLFLQVYQQMRQNDHKSALRTWRQTEGLIPLLFEEPNPAPLKYMLKQQGFIRSCEVRSPLTGISKDLQKELDAHPLTRPDKKETLDTETRL